MMAVEATDFGQGKDLLLPVDGGKGMTVDCKRETKRLGVGKRKEKEEADDTG